MSATECCRLGRENPRSRLSPTDVLRAFRPCALGRGPNADRPLDAGARASPFTLPGRPVDGARSTDFLGGSFPRSVHTARPLSIAVEPPRSVGSQLAAPKEATPVARKVPKESNG